MPEAELETSVAKAVSSLLTDVEGTVGVICPPSRLAATTSGLEAEGVRDDRVVVLTALQSKGLEYDGVLVVAPDEIVAQSPGGVRSLYVALTRPTQRLVTLDVTGSTRPGRTSSGPVRSAPVQ